jgi:hypothetical protein
MQMQGGSQGNALSENKMSLYSPRSQSLIKVKPRDAYSNYSRKGSVRHDLQQQWFENKSVFSGRFSKSSAEFAMSISNDI